MSISNTVFSVVGVETCGSSGTSVSSGAFPDGTDAVRLVCTEDAFIKFSPTSGAGTAVTAASTTGFFLAADLPEYFIGKPGQKLAVIQDSAAGILRVAYLARG